MKEALERRGKPSHTSGEGMTCYLMEYVGWKNVESAMRYVEAADPFAKRRIERSIQTALPPE